MNLKLSAEIDRVYSANKKILLTIFERKFKDIKDEYFYDLKNKTFVKGTLTTKEEYFDSMLLDIFNFKLEFIYDDGLKRFLNLKFVFENGQELSIEDYIDNFVEDVHEGQLFIKDVSKMNMKDLEKQIERASKEFRKYIVS